MVTGDNNIVNVDGLEYKNSSIRLWKWLLISKSYFYLGRLDEALDLLEKQELLRSTEDKHGSSTRESSIPFVVTVRELLHRKNAGNEAFQSGRHTEAVEHYTAVVLSSIESRPFAAICFCNRAAAHQSLGQIADAIADCSLAIALDGSYSKAVSRRATLHETIRDYEQAASDLHRLISLLEKQSQEKVQQCGSPDGSASGNVKELRQARHRLSSVEEKAKKGISLDHYLILLGCSISDLAVIAVALLWKNFQAYSMTKKLFPTGFYAAISAAMLCFYSYVVLSGGNPPPKKLKSSAVAPS